MTVDLYKLCPCGSGKKIKFCCRDLAHDFERIWRMIQGDQRLAAIDKIDSLLRKRTKDSERVALLMVKAEVKVQLSEKEAAQQIVDEILSIEPRNASGLALLAILKLMEPETTVREALDNLQNSLKNVRETMARVVYEALFTTVAFLAGKGELFSAKGYLQFAVMITDGKDARCVQMLNRINRSSELHFLLREHIDSSARPDNVTWGREFDVAMHIASQGNWGDAAAMLSDMSNRILDEPSILRNLAIIQALNAENELAAKTFRQFASLKRLPLLDRVHAEALATVLNAEPHNCIDLLRVQLELTDESAATEALLSNKRFSRFEVDSREADQPAPRAAFDVFDREPPADVEDVTLDDIVAKRANLLIFGKQTDRSALAEVWIRDDSNYDQTIEVICNAFGEAASEPSEPEAMGQMAESVAGVFETVDFRVVEDPNKRRELSQAYRRKVLLEVWPDKPRKAFGGKSPREVAQESPQDLRLLADLLTWEIDTELSQERDITVDDMRRAIGLPEREKIDLSKRKIEHVPVSHLGRVDIEHLSDDDLLKVYRYAYAVLAGGILYRIALEITKRDNLAEKVDLVEIYDVLSDLSSSSDDALEWLEKARKLATAQGESPAHWLIDEMELRLTRNEPDRFVALFKEIRNRYLEEPGVKQAVYGLFRKYGMVTPDGSLATDLEAAQIPAEEETEPAGVWTPESSAATAGSKAESKLWVPD